ncbi:MAG: N,N-dimethylformamidase beta subunit family domain-containing protein [Ilumatobacteraceae bacterium]
MADDVTHYDAIEAYCDRLSYAAGDTVRLHTWCATAQYDVAVARWDADGPGRAAWSATGIAGVAHPTPDTADASGCGWPAAVDIPVADDWRSGVYLVTLHAHGAVHERAVGHAMFVVRATRPTSPMLLVLATNTYNAYNNWGGRSLYTGGHQVSFDRPFGRGLLVRPRVDNIDRKSPVTAPGHEPDIDGAAYQEYRWAHGYPGYMSSSGWFAYERRFVEWAESQDIAFDYAVSSDLEQRPSVVSGYRLVLGVGHDEYWSAAQRDTVERHVADGGNYASFSGNTMFWQVRLSRGGRDMTAFKYRAHRDDPVLGTDRAETMSGMWCDPIVGRPEWWFLGAGSAFGLYSRFGRSTPRASGGFTVYRDTHWMFEGTGLRYGDQLGASLGAVGYETVGCRLGLDEFGLPVSMNADRPPDIEVVAFAPSSNLGAGDYPASVAASSEQCDLEFVASRLYGDESPESIARVRHGNAVMLTCRPSSAGTVATIGSTDWVYALGDPAVAQVTRNVLQRLSR